MYVEMPAENYSKALRGCRLAGQGVVLAGTPTVGFCRRAEEDRGAQAPPGFSPEAEDCGYSSVLLTRAKESLGWAPGLRLRCPWLIPWTSPHCRACREF